MKYTLMKFVGLLVLAGVVLTCQKPTQPNVSATVYLFTASHLADENGIPLFPGETSVQTIQAVLNDSQEIIEQLRQTFGYTRVELEDFQKFYLERKTANQNYFFRLGKYFVRFITLKGENPDQVSLSVALFSGEYMNGQLSRLSPQEQLFWAALNAPNFNPFLRVRVVAPLNESVILGKAIAPKGTRALFLVVQLRKAEPQERLESKAVIVYHDENDIKQLMEVIKKSQPQVQEDSIPNVAPFHALSEKPRVIKRAFPEYPEVLRKAGIEDRVIVKVLIDEQGKVIRTQLLKPSRYPAFNQVALEAAKKFVFKPGRTREKAVKVWMTIPFDFRLKRNPQ